jgi:hypothetical protein
MKSSTKLVSRHKVLRLIVRIAIISLVVGCQNPITFDLSYKKANAESKPQKVAISGSSFTLAWDDEPLGTSTYSVYTRPHGGSLWAPVVKGLASPSLVVTNALLPYGSYEFAVSRVSADGVESTLLTSLDASAIPDTGWYIEWTA